MKRQILVFTPPSEREVDRALAEAPAEGRSSELGHWLTHELRVKGAPKPSRPPAPIVLPAPDALDASQADFGRWLTSELRPRGGSVPPPDALMAPEQPDALAAQVQPDSLAPQVWPELDGPRITLVPELDDDDLSVLPARPKALALFGSPQGRRSVAAVGVVLLAFGFFLMRGAESVPGSAESAAAAEVIGTRTPAVLLPPPPEVLPSEPDESAVEEEAPATVGKGGAKWPEPAEARDPATPRYRLGGPSVARFPDLPAPKLSELARDGQQAASERDAAVRKAKRSSP